MEASTAKRLAWALGGVALTTSVAGLVVGISRGTLTDAVEAPPGLDIAAVILYAAFATCGVLIARRYPANPIGWLFLSISLTFSFGVVAHVYALSTPPPPGRQWALWVSAWSGVLALPLIPLMLLVFPDGHLLSKRWRIAVIMDIGAIVVFVLAFAFTPGPLSGQEGAEDPIVNPAGIGALAGTPEENSGLGWVLMSLVIPAAAVSLLLRYRRSIGVVREQIKWVALAGVLFASGFLASAFTYGTRAENVGAFVAAIGFASVPAAIGIAILRYRLFDIDFVISKAVVYGVLAAFITVVYVGIVVGVGALAESVSNAFLSAIAAAVVAIAFQPVRRRAQRLANRVVYGKRATPYEVLTAFSERMAGAYASDDVLPRMAQILGQGTGASSATVWLRLDDRMRPVATWPTGGAPPSLPDGAVEISHRGEVLGALSVEMPPNDPMSPATVKLVRDLAAQAGLVLRNVRLVEELRESRRRIVAAQDEERRRIERNIHDGAQQQLVALAVKERLAESLVGKDEERARAMLVELRAETNDALENLRDLARGIYPPLLADEGLAAALGSQARKSPVPVKLQVDGVGRYPREIESAVYFSVLEALQNVAKYAAATRVEVRLSDGTDGLRFEVADDGVGFDPAATRVGTGLRGIDDRLDAVGGRVEVTSTPGDGTTVTGSIPRP